MSERPILVADDDEQVRRLLERFLQRMSTPHPVVTVGDGDAAVAYLEASLAGTAAVPTLLILDENMPGLTGREILRWRRERDALAGVPTILLTGAAVASDIDVVLDSVFLPKPLSFEQFRQVLEDLGVQSGTDRD